MPITKGLTVLIVDDNVIALETLAEDLKRQPEIGRVLTFRSYAEATLPLLEEQPDVLFLDVEVPGKTGLDFLQSIRPHITFKFNVVFYTGFSNYMIDAIRMAAFDFLLKPYKLSELREIINRLVSCKNENPLQYVAGGSNLPQKIAIQAISEVLLITIEQILIINYQSNQRSWILTLTDHTTHRLRKGTNAQELIALHPILIKVNNTCIINMTYLAAIENNTQLCRLCPPFNDIKIIASRRCLSKLKEKIELL